MTTSAIWCPNLHGRTRRIPGDTHQTRSSLSEKVERWLTRHRSATRCRCHTHPYALGVRLSKTFNAKGANLIREEILHNRIREFDEFEDAREIRGVLQISHDVATMSIYRQIVRGVMTKGGRCQCAYRVTIRAFDLYDICTQVARDHRAHRTSQHP